MKKNTGKAYCRKCGLYLIGEGNGAFCPNSHDWKDKKVLLTEIKKIQSDYIIHENKTEAKKIQIQIEELEKII